MTELENRAHAQKVLMSSDAMRFFMRATNVDERNEKLDAVIEQAKESFPSEGGWVVINLARIESLSSDETVVATADVVKDMKPTTAGSLAEAIIDGNIIAAYEMIAHRPMIALADAAADLDAVYRSRKGESVAVSDKLMEDTQDLTDEVLQKVITALTSAVDGTYTDEASAVKVAIMKAVTAVA